MQTDRSAPGQILAHRSRIPPAFFWGVPNPLFFDLDGTLTDPGEGITRCFAYALAKMRHSAPPLEELRACVGPPLADSFRELLQTEDRAEIDDAIRHYRLRYVERGMLENERYPGVLELLGSLQCRGHALWVVTSKPAVYAEQIVEHFGMADFFRGVHGPDLEGNRADRRELIAHVLGAEGLADLDEESRPG